MSGGARNYFCKPGNVTWPENQIICRKGINTGADVIVSALETRDAKYVFAAASIFAGGICFGMCCVGLCTFVLNSEKCKKGLPGCSEPFEDP